ncbi:AMP-binding enzyme [Pseudocolwellia sp. HL-MZ19]|uniref:AMP-binding enzyme n=1 Tax=unclassified Pseudocolwellia TaxID=2848178 RepID=UPI003CF2411C
MNTTRKSDIYQTNDCQAKTGYSTDESKDLTLNNPQPWKNFLNKNHGVSISTNNQGLENKWAEIVAGDYIWVIEDPSQALNIQRHRLASSVIEGVLQNHPQVQEVAVIGLPHEQKGNVIHAFVILKTNTLVNENIKQALQEMVSTEIGSIAVPECIEFMECLPKTSSGKVIRKTLKAQKLEQKLALLN